MLLENDSQNLRVDTLNVRGSRYAYEDSNYLGWEPGHLLGNKRQYLNISLIMHLVARLSNGIEFRRLV